MYCLPPDPHVYSPPSLPHSGLACSLLWTASIGSLALHLLTESSQWNALVEIRREKENKSISPDPLHPGPLPYVCVLLRHRFWQGALLCYWSIFKLRKELSPFAPSTSYCTTCPDVLSHPLLLCLSLAFTLLKKNPFHKLSSINQIDYVICFLPEPWLNTFPPNPDFKEEDSEVVLYRLINPLSTGTRGPMGSCLPEVILDSWSDKETSSVFIWKCHWSLYQGSEDAYHKCSISLLCSKATVPSNALCVGIGDRGEEAVHSIGSCAVMGGGRLCLCRYMTLFLHARQHLILIILKINIFQELISWHDSMMKSKQLC